jgi:DNA-directed RNA polymerase specialized sigma24 family protein
VESRGSERAQRGPASTSLKLDLSDSIDESWLEEFDDDQSEYLRRLDTDRSIIDDLAEVGFQGYHYEYFAIELVKYGIAVMTAWTRTGQIFAVMRNKRHVDLARPIGDDLRDQDTARELACETVAYAIKRFREYVLIPNRWDPSKGASIKTYFIGQCLIQFPNVYRRWYGETFEPAHLETIDSAVKRQGYEHVEQVVTDRLGVSDLLTTVKKDRTKRILILHGAGHSYKEIAARLSITEKTVEMSIRNERNRQQGRQAG